MKLTRKRNIAIAIYVVLFCTYIFPTGMIAEGNYTIPKMIFVGTVGILYIFMKISSQTLNRFEAIFICIITLLTIITHNINYLLFITLCYLEEMVKYKNDVIEFFDNSKILYICLIFTLFYTLCFIGSNDSRGRYAFTAIKEINLSGLAIFCLGCMLLSKNKKVGIFTLAFGCLSLSRSYFLGLICLIFYKYFKKFLKLDKKIIELFNYLNITIISSIILILLGVFYINQYKVGNIFLNENDTSRLITFLDYSNYFRFQAVIVVIMILKKHFSTTIFGMNDTTYISLGKKISSEMKVPFMGTPPHNLFFSHLKIYGIFALIEIQYVSKILKEVVSENSFGVYIGIVLYSVFLGAGLYSYWFFLTLFTLIYFDKNLNLEQDKMPTEEVVKE